MISPLQRGQGELVVTRANSKTISGLLMSVCSIRPYHCFSESNIVLELRVYIHELGSFSLETNVTIGEARVWGFEALLTHA